MPTVLCLKRYQAVKEKVLVRGYTIQEQLRMKEHSEQNGDGAVTIGLSQESETMFTDDYTFIKKLQEEQKEHNTLI